MGISLLRVAAVFQLFDGVQAVATGALRGLGDTRTPMIWNLFGHWFVGLPLGYMLCFTFGVGIVGLWWGLSSRPDYLRRRPSGDLVGAGQPGICLAAGLTRRARSG